MESSSSAEGWSLSEQFDECESALVELESGRIPTNRSAEDVATDVYSSLRECSRLVKSMALFSVNEDLDDISTSTLKYLLIDFIAADVLISRKMKPSRMLNLKTAVVHLSSFLALAERVGALRPEDLIQMSRDAAPDPYTARTEKIARYKRQKVSSEKVKLLYPTIVKVREKKSAGQSTEVANDAEEYDSDEIVREYYIAKIDESICLAFEHKNFSAQELHMLEQMQQLLSLEQDNNNANTKPGFVSVPASSVSKDEIKKGVFKPDHILPLYTPEEAADWDIKDMREREQREAANAKAKADSALEKDSDDDEEKVDAQTLKKRNWDDWADAHPRGSGNMYRKY